MDYSPPGSSAHGDSPSKNTEVGCPALLQEIFPNQRWNPGLPYCMQIRYHLRHEGSPGGEVAFPNVTTVLQSVQRRIFPNPRMEPRSPASPALQADSSPTETPGKPLLYYRNPTFFIIQTMMSNTAATAQVL